MKLTPPTNKASLKENAKSILADLDAGAHKLDGALDEL